MEQKENRYKTTLLIVLFGFIAVAVGVNSILDNAIITWLVTEHPIISWIFIVVGTFFGLRFSVKQMRSSKDKKDRFLWFWWGFGGIIIMIWLFIVAFIVALR